MAKQKPVSVDKRAEQIKRRRQNVMCKLKKDGDVLWLEGKKKGDIITLSGDRFDHLAEEGYVQEYTPPPKKDGEK